MAEVIVIVEARADAEIATKLAERVLVEAIDWLEADQVEYLLQWRGLEQNTDYSCWKDISDITQRCQASGLRIPRTRGHSSSGPLRADGPTTRKILNLIRVLQKTQPEIKALLLIRDLDNQPDRRHSLEQARQEEAQRLPSLQIILGTADPKREAWVLNGFLAETKSEKQILAELKDKLGFDPCQEAHRLRSTASQADRTRDSKAVLDRLTQKNYPRERQCWEETDLDYLRLWGQKTGLRNYLLEIEQFLSKIPDLNP